MSVTSLLLWLLPMIVVVLRQWSGEWYTAIKDANYVVGKTLVNTSPVPEQCPGVNGEVRLSQG